MDSMDRKQRSEDVMTDRHPVLDDPSPQVASEASLFQSIRKHWKRSLAALHREYSQLERQLKEERGRHDQNGSDRSLQFMASNQAAQRKVRQMLHSYLWALDNGAKARKALSDQRRMNARIVLSAKREKEEAQADLDRRLKSDYE